MHCSTINRQHALLLCSPEPQTNSVPQLLTCCLSAGKDLVSIDSFVQHNGTACAYLGSLSDTLATPTPSMPPSLAHQEPITTILTLDQLLNGSIGIAKVPAVYKTCLTECILGSTDFDAILIGLSDLYEQVRMLQPLCCNA